MTNEPHQDLIDTLSLLTLQKHITKDEALAITTEAKSRFPDGNPAYGQAVLWQMRKDFGLTPDDPDDDQDLDGAALTVLRGVLVGTITAQRLLAIARELGPEDIDAHTNALCAGQLLDEANGLAVAFLESIKVKEDDIGDLIAGLERACDLFDDIQERKTKGKDHE